MDTKLIDNVTAEYKKVKHPNVRVGDLIEVHTKIKEGDKERIQIFTGLVIAIKGVGVGKTFTVRKISYGVGVERIFPFFSPNIAKIKINKTGKVRRSKLYYLRKRVGKAALKAGVQIPVEGKDWETQLEEEMIEKEEVKKSETQDTSKRDEPAEKKDNKAKKELSKSEKESS